MRDRSYLLCIPCLLVGCATLPPSQHTSSAYRGSDGTAVSQRKYYELNSVADELNYEDPCTLARAARGTAFDECLLSFDCTYCRRGGGWWVLTACDPETTATARFDASEGREQQTACRKDCGAT